jgi:hypothetical protein
VGGALVAEFDYLVECALDIVGCYHYQIASEGLA